MGSVQWSNPTGSLACGLVVFDIIGLRIRLNLGYDSGLVCSRKAGDCRKVRFIKLIFIFLVMLVGAAFAVMNPEPVTLNYYFGTQVLPLPVVLVAAVGLGALLGVLVCLNRSLRLRRENSSLKQKAKLAAQELNNLRFLPIKDS